MKTNNLLIFLLSFTAFLTFSSGFIRHDVDEKEYLDFGNEPQFACVGQVFVENKAIGSCVLINKKYVLSAAHAFIQTDTRPDTLNMDGYQIVVYTPYNARVMDKNSVHLVFGGEEVKVKRIIIHPKYLDSISKGSCDLALIELEEAIKNIAPAKLNTAFNEKGSVVAGVGFGLSGPADQPDLVGYFNKKIAGENEIDDFSGIELNGQKTILNCDFDHPTNTLCNKMGSDIPRRLEYSCGGGDSGGGMFRKNKNKWELVGICSGVETNMDQYLKTGYYGQIMNWTRVSVFEPWVNENIK